jgi:hypothetical protein
MRKQASAIARVAVMALLLISGIGAKAQYLPKLTSKVTPQAIAMAREHEQKENRITMMPPQLTVGKKSLPSRRHVMPYRVPVKQSPMLRNVTSADGSKIYGCMIYNSTWTEDNQPYGIYSFNLGDGESIAAVATGDDYVATGGGVYANGKFYYVSYLSFMGYILADLNVCDFETWKVEESIPVEVGAVARDMTYDPETGNVYGCFMNDDADGWVFGRMSLETGERTVLSELDLVFVVIAANSKGEVYGIDLLGDLYKFDKLTGAKTLIGNTGRKPAYSASGCFDMRTDKLYWECMESDAVARVFEVNVSDASVTLSTTLPDSSELVAMFIPVPEADDDAPAAVDDLTVNFDGASLTGTINFSLPVSTFAGDLLSGDLHYVVTQNEVALLSGDAAAGTKLSLPVTVSTDGDYRFAVTVSNSVGKSPVALVEQWVGYDIPASVTNLKLAKADAPNKVKLTWTAVTTTVHNGFINSDDVRYKVVRLPDNVVASESQAETSFEETLPAEAELTTYSYEVTAINNNYSSVATQSNALSIGVASLPFKETFDENGIDLFYVVDVNGDGFTWTYDGTWEAARIRYSSANDYTAPKDDWLFAPLVALKNDRLYHFSFDTRCYMTSEPERIEVKLGKAQSVEAMTQEVFPVIAVTNDVLKTYDKYISVAEAGNYSFGIHACSLADKMYLYVDNVEIAEGPLLGTPAAVTNVSAVAGANGALTATVSFNAPTKTVEGGDLSEISAIRVFRNNAIVKMVNNPAPGEAVTFEDNGAKQGNNTYTFICDNSIGTGFSATTTVFVGHDYPGLVSNVRAVDNNGTVTITWDAPTKGANGGYFDADALSYIVTRANDETIVANKTTALTATDANPPLGGYQQEFFAYYVYAVSPAGVGDGLMSNIVPVGEAFALPFKESFPGCTLTNDPWDVEAPDDSNGSWSLVAEGTNPEALPQDNDGGMVCFMPSEEGDKATLYTGKIDFTNASNPILQFYYYYISGSRDYLTIYISADGAEFEKLQVLSYYSQNCETGWQSYTVNLSKYASAKYVQLAFEAESYDGSYYQYLDNIKVRNLYNYNLSVDALNVPKRLKVGSASDVVATVDNTGIVPASKYTVNLLVNGDVIDSQEGVSLMQDETNDFTFSVTPTVHFGKEAVLTAEVVWDKDEDAIDNSLSAAAVPVTQPNYPAVDDLEASLNDNEVTLTWNEPLPSDADGSPVVDGAESYKAFAIANVGDWTMVDRDKSATYGIGDSSGSTLAYDNAGKAMAFMVFNPGAAGIVTDGSVAENVVWAPYEGSQMFAAFASSDGQNDDWMISPELTGEAQEISFFVKTVVDTWGLEQYEVLYSSTGDDVNDFVKIGATREAPDEWTEVKVVLPAGARYFAIRCVSTDCFAFLVDNIKYLPLSAVREELSLIGYNVYCNRTKLNTDPVEELTFVDTIAADETRDYYVTAVYDKGESPISNIVSVSTSGVGKVSAASSIKVVGEHGAVRVLNAAGSDVTIYAVDGRLVAKRHDIGNNAKINVLNNTIYAVRVGNNSYIVAVK